MNSSLALSFTILLSSFAWGQSFQIERTPEGWLSMRERGHRDKNGGPQVFSTIRSSESLSMLPGGLEAFLAKPGEACLLRFNNEGWTVAKRWSFDALTRDISKLTTPDIFLCDHDIPKAISHGDKSIYVLEQSGVWKKESLIPDEIYRRFSYDKLGKTVLLRDGSFVIIAGEKNLFEIYDPSNWKEKKIIAFDSDTTVRPLLNYRDPQYCFSGNRLWVYFRMLGRLFALDTDRLMEEEITRLPWKVLEDKAERAKSREAWDGRGIFIPEYPVNGRLLLNSEGSVLLAGQRFSNNQAHPVIAEIQESEKKVVLRPDLQEKFQRGAWIFYSAATQVFMDAKTLLKAAKPIEKPQP